MPLSTTLKAEQVHGPSTMLAAAGTEEAGYARAAIAPPSGFCQFFVVVALGAIPLVVTLRPVGAPVCDPDVWWHLAVGKWVVAQRAVPTTDPFSTSSRDKPWVAYSWLYEVLIYGLFNVFGLAGIVLYRAALALAIAAAVFGLVNRGRPPPLLAASLTGVALLPLAMLFSERPWLFTILFGALTLHAVLDVREGRRSLLPWLLPVVFALWANVHIQFIYGLALLGLACAAPLLDRCWPSATVEPPGAVGATRWRALLGLACACWLATLVNPYHVRLYAVVLEYATQPGPFLFVNELKAPEFREPCDWAMLAFAGAAAFALGRRSRCSSFDVLLLIGSAFLAFRARRDLWVLMLAALAILTAGPLRAAVAGPRWQWTWLRRGAVAIALAAVALGLWRVRDLSPARLEATAAAAFPVDAARQVAAMHYPGPLYNDFNWGGFLIWALPELPVALDGRTNLHGDERLLRFGAVWAGVAGWHDDPDLAAAGVVVAARNMPLASLLASDPRFTLVYDDDLAQVFIPRR